MAARAVFTVRSAAWYCLRARCAGGTGGNCLIFTDLAAAVPGAVRHCSRAHRHAGCAAATVACTVGSAGPACLGFCVTFLSLLSSSSPSVLPGLVVGVLGAHRHAGCAAATVACRVDLRAQDGIFVFGHRSKATPSQGEDRRASKHIKVAPRLLTTDGSTTCFLRS